MTTGKIEWGEIFAGFLESVQNCDLLAQGLDDHAVAVSHHSVLVEIYFLASLAPIRCISVNFATVSEHLVLLLPLHIVIVQPLPNLLVLLVQLSVRENACEQHVVAEAFPRLQMPVDIWMLLSEGL